MGTSLLISAARSLNHEYFKKYEKETNIMENKYLKIDGEDLQELFELYGEDLAECIDELNKYDKQLFMYELHISTDDTIKKYVNIWKFMNTVFDVMDDQPF